MAAYLVIEAQISDLEGFSCYAKVVPPLVAQFGGEYLVLGGEHEALEGDWGKTKVVLHRWPSMEAARRFWQSDEYQEAKRLRDGTGQFRVMLVSGVAKEKLEG